MSQLVITKGKVVVFVLLKVLPMLNITTMRKVVPYFVLLFCLALTVFIWRFSIDFNRASAQERYRFRTDQITSVITKRVEDYATVLRGGAALFAASNEVTRTEWRTYVEHLRVSKTFPGIQGLGFSKVIQPAELAQHIQQIRAEGFPSYTVRPPGERDVYTSIIFLEPFDVRNQRAFGYDMFSEPVRRVTMEHARDTDTPSISGQVKLVQEIGQDVQAGFLMYVPVYRVGMSIESVEERRAAIQGYVYSPFRVGNLMRGIFSTPVSDIDIKIYDGTELSKSSMMYHNSDLSVVLNEKVTPLFSSRKIINLYGHQWTLAFTTLSPFESTVEQFQSWGILFAGIVISVLAFLFIRTQEHTREHALALAQEMTAALRKREEELCNSEAMWHGLVNANPESVFLIDPTGLILAANETIAQRLSQDVQGMVGVNIFDLLPPTVAIERKARVDQVVASGKPIRFEDIRGGRYIDNYIQPIFDSEGKLTRLAVLGIDVTERKQAEDVLLQKERFEAIIEAAQVGTWDWNVQTGELAFNECWAEIVGYSLEEIAPTSIQTWMDLAHPDDLKKSDLLLEKHFSGEMNMYECECRMKHKDGQWVYVLDRGKVLTRTADGRPLRMLGTHLDITDRKKAEEEIVRQLQRVRALRQVDIAIMGADTVSLSLKTVLEQMLAVLHVDAADIFLLNPHTQTLEYTAGLGFRSKNLERSELRIGEGIAGRAALEQEMQHISTLASVDRKFVSASLIESEDFVECYAVPLVVKGNVNGVLEIFHKQPFDFDANGFDFLYALAGQAAIAIDNNRLFSGLQRANKDLLLAYDTTIEGWSRALDLRDKETEGHTLRVTEMTIKFARLAGLTDAELVHVRRGALLHDIGKMGVPDGILLKPGKLTEDEWVIMRQHPQFSFEMLSPIVYLRQALDIPYCHHEKWDGSGYPRGLNGEQIPLAARLFAVVDVWDALCFDRPYRKSWPEDKVLEYIRSLAGTQFDPTAVELFLNMMIDGKKNAD